MKKLIIGLMLASGIAQAQVQTPLREVGLKNEQVEFFTTDQITTFVLTSAIGGVVGEFVENKTRSKALGVLSGAVVGGLLGYAKDKWDHSNNTAIVNNIPPFNDSLAGVVGGAFGGLTLRFNIFEGRKRSKAGFGHRYNRKRRKYRN